MMRLAHLVAPSHRISRSHHLGTFQADPEDGQIGGLSKQRRPMDTHRIVAPARLPDADRRGVRLPLGRTGAQHPVYVVAAISSRTSAIVTAMPGTTLSSDPLWM